MNSLVHLVIATLAIVIFIWLLSGCSAQPITDRSNATPSGSSSDASEDQLIAMAIGMSGGDVKDAAIARYALKRFEETNGCKATAQDMGFVVGMMKSMK